MFNSFPLCRSIFEHWIYTDANCLKIWITMLGKARYKKETKTSYYQNIKYTLGYGEFIFGRTQWSKELNIGEQRIRTCLKRLLEDNMIVNIKATPKFTIYSIVNYEKFNQHTNQQPTEQFQSFQGICNQQTNQQLTSNQPATNQQLTTNKEGKEGKEGNAISPITNNEPLKDTSTEIPFKEIIDYLNLKADKKFSSNSSATRKLINARFNDNAKYTLGDFIKVIDIKTIEWNHEPSLNEKDMRIYLRPQTLFGVNNFENYLNQPFKTQIKEKPKYKPVTRRDDF